MRFAKYDIYKDHRNLHWLERTFNWSLFFRLDLQAPDLPPPHTGRWLFGQVAFVAKQIYSFPINDSSSSLNSPPRWPIDKRLFGPVISHQLTCDSRRNKHSVSPRNTCGGIQPAGNRGTMRFLRVDKDKSNRIGYFFLIYFSPMVTPLSLSLLTWHVAAIGPMGSPLPFFWRKDVQGGVVFLIAEKKH
jgi:hypothetical protein